MKQRSVSEGERLNCLCDIRPQEDTMVQWYNVIIFDTNQSMSTRFEFLHTRQGDCDANLLSVLHLRIGNSHSIKSNDSEMHKARIVLKARVWRFIELNYLQSNDFENTKTKINAGPRYMRWCSSLVSSHQKHSDSFIEKFEILKWSNKQDCDLPCLSPAACCVPLQNYYIFCQGKARPGIMMGFGE